MNNTKESITCDSCGKELIVPSPWPHVWALRLAPIDVNRPVGNFQYAAELPAPISRPMEFCNIRCLSNWCKAVTVVEDEE